MLVPLSGSLSSGVHYVVGKGKKVRRKKLGIEREHVCRLWGEI